MFSHYYHAQHSHNIEDIPFWLDLARMVTGPILELGCGTGRVLLALRATDHVVCGVDNDHEMLCFLRRQVQNLPDKGIMIVEADFEHFRLGQKFGLIVMPCNTLSSLSEQARKNVSGCTRQHLLPGGIFAFSVPNPSVMMKLPEHAESEIEEIFTHPEDGEPVQVSSAWERSADSIIFIWNYDHLLPDGTVDRLTRHVKQYLVPTQTYLDEMKDQGFIIQAMYGDFDYTKHTPRSPYLIGVVNKPLDSEKP